MLEIGKVYIPLSVRKVKNMKMGGALGWKTRNVQCRSTVVFEVEMGWFQGQGGLGIMTRFNAQQIKHNEGINSGFHVQLYLFHKLLFSIQHTVNENVIKLCCVFLTIYVHVRGEGKEHAVFPSL